MSRRAVTLPAIVLASCALCGCAATTRYEDSPTGGLMLELLYRGPESATAYYEVDRDGVLSFGGGIDARMKRTSWSGAMTPEEIGELLALIREHRWYEDKPTSTGAAPPIYDVELRGPQGYRDFRVNGESAEIEPVRALLDRASRRRIDPYLETLPRPGEQR